MSIELDWNALKEKLEPKKYLEYDKVKDVFTKVAFDVYKNNNSEKLWTLEDGDDGKQYLVALYEDGEGDIVSESNLQKDWVATPDSNGKNITLAYKKTPIARFSSEDYSFDSSNSSKFAQFLEKKASDGRFVNDLLDIMPEAKKIAILKLLAKGAK